MPALFPFASTRTLSPAEARSLTAAVTSVMAADEEHYRSPVRQTELRHLVAEAWPGWAELLGDVRRQLAESPHACLVRGLPLVDAARALVALSCGLGEVVEPYRRPWSRLVRKITPSTDRGGGAGILNERLHTDGTDWPEPNNITCLLCVRPDSDGGGRSRLLSIESVANLVESQSAAVRRAVRTELPWAVAEELGGGVVAAPVLSNGGVRWLRFTLDEAVRRLADEDSVPPGETRDALGVFEAALETASGVVEFGLRPGDLLLVHNTRCLHSRTAVPNPQASGRLLLRTKVAACTGQLGEYLDSGRT